MKNRPLLGAHLSVAGGVWRAVERAKQLGCSALQIFTQSPGRWQGSALEPEDAARFRAAAASARLVGATFAHAAYVINVASGDERLSSRSEAALSDQLERARLLGLDGLVLHPGAHLGDGAERGVARAAAVLNRVLAGLPGAPRLLVEVTAGQGSCLGACFAELAALLELLPADRVGVCWDTAHLWAGGYDPVTERGYRRLWKEFRAVTGRSGPDLIHLNDTDVERGARVDRHQRIGHGRLGLDTFARIVRDRRLARVAMVLETPKGPDEVTWDREALELLRAAAAR